VGLAGLDLPLVAAVGHRAQLADGELLGVLGSRVWEGDETE
jgi:hypothetical protein